MHRATEVASSLATCPWQVSFQNILQSTPLTTLKIDDPGDPADRNSSRALDYANFKRNVYHKVAGVMFEPLEKPSRSGMSLRCGDQIQRVLYPGIPIEALDGEEACSACACRAALANHPCPRCLVHHNQLDLIDKQFIPRTTETMREVYRASQEASTRTAAGDILKDYGLHATEVGGYFYYMLLR
jgi:Plavaka transposase